MMILVNITLGSTVNSSFSEIVLRPNNFLTD